ncbi:hypothetical protein AVEN_92942-1 [Araneus ventricosus]|uniref:Uncharacterized protein n=1 Tax=Araneus ventricosus TaxID=182803 RepID=A0A4Y2NC62_ARAVE|nr:hypothetical protein AVEN_92942-1 [Araneus ventricosus]
MKQFWQTKKLAAALENFFLIFNECLVTYCDVSPFPTTGSPDNTISRRMKGVPKGTTQDERKWATNLPTLRKPTRAQWQAVPLVFSGKTTRVSADEDLRLRLTTANQHHDRKAHDGSWVICPA